jgi:hypothetical protein
MFVAIPTTIMIAIIASSLESKLRPPVQRSIINNPAIPQAVAKPPVNLTAKEIIFIFTHYNIIELTRVGGEREIRTPGGVSPTPPFQGGTLNRSAISPYIELIATTRQETPLSSIVFCLVRHTIMTTGHYTLFCIFLHRTLLTQQSFDPLRSRRVRHKKTVEAF